MVGRAKGKHVLVVAEGRGIASTAIGARGGSVHGFGKKAYIHTDRPVYRPGQKMQWRAAYLVGKGGSYRVPGKTKGFVEIRDARDNVVAKEDVTSSALGTFSGSFMLTDLAPIGTWSVHLRLKRAGPWKGTFRVEAYRKPELLIGVETEQDVLATGETLKGHLAVTYAFGAPAAEIPVRWQAFVRAKHFEVPDPDDYSWYVRGSRSDPAARTRTRLGQPIAQGEGVSDAAGRFAFEVPTEDAVRDAELILRAYVQDVTGRWTMDEDAIPLVQRDHLGLVRTSRRVVRPKETFSLDVRTVDARLRPVARQGEVHVLRVRREALGPAKLRRSKTRAVREVTTREATHAVTTDRSGHVALDLTVPGPGKWRLRYEGRDKRGRVVIAETDVEASGDAEDASRDARLLIAQPAVKEGETADVLIRSPVQAKRALLTVEGSRVLEHRFVEIAGTSTSLALAMHGDFAPNVFVAIAIPGADRLLEASDEVVVLRHLDVQIKAVPERARPGDEVEIQIVTRDVQGKPVAAELGLGVVDSTVYAIARDAAEQIRPYFYDRRRNHTVGTSSSLGLRLFGTTREANQDLLEQRAVRAGGGKAAEVRSALRLARSALSEGDHAAATRHGLAALRMDPSSWDARALMTRIAREAGTEDLPGLVAAADELKAGPERARAMDSLRRLEARHDRLADKEEMDVEFEESFGAGAAEGASDAPFEGPSSNAAIGLGGGGGGTFGGRGGSRRKSAKVLRQQAAPAQAYANDLALHALPQVDTVNLPQQWLNLLDAEWGAALEGLRTRSNFRDTAAWAPQVTTDSTGRGTIKLHMPDNLTTWRITARGVSAEALVGEARGAVEVRRPVIVRLDAPRFLVAGDEVVLPTAIHNHTDATLIGKARLAVEGARAGGSDQDVAVEPGTPKVVERTLHASARGAVRMEARFETVGGGDARQVRVGTKARGLPILDARTGLVDTKRGDKQELSIDVPSDVVPGTQRLEIVLHPDLFAAVEDALLQTRFFPYGCVEQTVHRFLPAVHAAKALRDAQHPSAMTRDQLRASIAAGARRLMHAQRDDGGFGWFRGRDADVAMTAYALRGLRAAHNEGFAWAGSAAKRALDALDRLLPKARPDIQALAHLARSEGGTVSNQAFAATYRHRQDGMSAGGLAWLAVAAERAGRRYEAESLIRLLLSRVVEAEGMSYWAGSEHHRDGITPRRATALALWALVETKTETPHADRALAWLLARGRCQTTLEAAAFVETAAALVSRGRAHGFGGEIDLVLDGRLLRTVSVGADAPGALKLADRVVVVDDMTLLQPGRRALTVRLRGQGHCGYLVRLRATRASEDLPGASHGLTLTRRYLQPRAAPKPGEPPRVEPGYSVWREASRPRIVVEDLHTVAVSDRVLVRLTLKSDTKQRYVLVEDRLPAGFEVLDDTASGPYAWQERREDRQVFFLDVLPAGTTTLDYVLQATHQGRFTALGATCEAMYQPEVHGRSDGVRLRVRSSAIKREADAEAEPTPDEEFHRAQRLVAKRSFKAAKRALDALAEQPLRDSVREDLEILRLKSAIGLEDAAGTVRAREELVRRSPGKIPTDLKTLRAIARAYHSLGDTRVANSLYRDLCAQGLLLEQAWRQELTGRWREVEGLDHIGAVLREHGINNATASIELKRAQRYFELQRPEGRRGLAGAPMDTEALRALWHAGAHHANTAASPVLRYALVGGLRRRGDDTAAAAEAELFLDHHGKHHFVDDVRWFLAQARFEVFSTSPSDEGAALVDAAARPLLKDKFPTQRGSKSRSPHRHGAYHLLGQVQHALGNLEAAASYYRHARNIEDAREARAWLTDKRLSMPATVHVHADRELHVPVHHRNVKQVEVQVYPVDLQVLFVVRRSLTGLHEIQLTGIRPAQAFTKQLEAPRPLEDSTTELVVPVETRDAGAWLVVVRGAGRDASSIVVRSDLRVRTQRVAKRLRVYVTDKAGATVPSALVTVAASGSIVARGRTDARGVFEAPAVSGEPDIVVSKGDRYAVAGQ